MFREKNSKEIRTGEQKGRRNKNKNNKSIGI